MVPLRVLELYNGIGGMHHALRESCIPAQVVAAIDVNTVANEVYKYNFPHTPLLAKTIEGITLEEFDKLSFNMILMSPPCQPFTRIGLQGDMTDRRTNSFLHILDILPRDLLIETIENCGFQYQEFLLSPTALGIPNSRLRYFLITRLQSEPLPFHAPGQVLMDFPKIESEQPQKHSIGAENRSDVKQIEPNTCFDSPQCSAKDIVKPACRRSMCFTKGYGSYVEGTGSVLQTAEDVQIETIYKSLTSLPEEEQITKLSMLKLRCFTPKEIANLLGFPPEFGFPKKITTKQCYCLLGNSLNVHVVAKLIKILYE
ncbi:tRNA (cytosine(38)-C(5))-methyltransferase-like isoform X2 [Octodon degus]|uniref:tRNA (Cytosine(38)-C(5))-methyltransferase-like isoform X2 n=1 Tax=Octodon degus TaxID=10160 RepID=A0A6P6DCW0_OCTDE|nr:tRNA (cytosine(38)-C(5))-methyltransferase-like isoform X2 [Octodon degus]